jgi:hypothetical protein
MRVPKLEMHVTHRCNLRCAGCNHFANDGGGKPVPFELGASWLRPWSARIEPVHFSFLGGEPLLNPELPEYLRLGRAIWPHTHIRLISNGLLLDRWRERLWIVLAETSVRLTISVHSRDPRYVRRLEPVLARARDLAAAHGVVLESRDCVTGWYRPYRGAGRAMLPFEDGDPEASWQVCESKHCVTLQDNALWKCPPIAHLPRVAEAFDLARQPAWHMPLRYQPLGLEASDDELRAFFARRHEAICGMCPARLEYFEKTVF